MLETRNNPISLGMTLETLRGADGGPTMLGSMLFSRFVSGVRTVSTTATKDISGYHFEGYGAHIRFACACDCVDCGNLTPETRTTILFAATTRFPISMRLRQSG